MAEIVRLAQVQKTQRPAGADPAPCRIILFTGVRYDHSDVVEPSPRPRHPRSPRRIQRQKA